MNSATPYPPMEALIPHRGMMLLVERIVDDSPSELHAQARIHPQAWYADANGNMPAMIGVELMAQTVAAFIGLPRWRKGESARIGFLLGTRKYICAVPMFPANTQVDIKIRVMYREESGLAAFECAIELEHEALATAILTVFEPEDAASFRMEQSS